MTTSAEYRYPGSRPFQDTDLDRKLFFGRDKEKEELLHLILAEKLVVVFAKSGMGKSSLINAGVLQPLRERGFCPLKIRFNDPKLTPLQTVYTSINDAIVQQQIDAQPGDESLLRQYFETTDFWSPDDMLLTPILILDQFEDFFEFHVPEERHTFIAQLAELKSDVRVIIAIREDFLGQVEELAQEIPAILSNRFRLTALKREHAREAIENPAKLQDEHLTTGFSYAPEAVTAMLNFLCKRKERDKVVVTDEVEPFQLQLLCQDIETKMRQQQKNVVQVGDLGGESGMEKVLQSFYDHQLKLGHSRRNRKRVRRLCEQGLLSSSNRRLSLEEEDIEQRFKVKKTVLAELVNNRLLRAEPRVGSVYYELCHDTLVAPIRQSQRTHKIKTRTVGGILGMLLLIGILILSGMSLWYIAGNYRMIKNVRTALIYPERFLAAVHRVMGRTFYKNGEIDEAIIQYQKAIPLNPNDSDAYVWLATFLQAQGKGEEAITQCQKALGVDPKNVWAHIKLGSILTRKGDFAGAIASYQKAIKIIEQEGTDGYVWVWGWGEGDFLQAKRSLLRNYNAWAYQELAMALQLQGKFEEANAQYRKLIEMQPEKVVAYYFWLADALETQGKIDEAIAQYRKLVDLDPNNKYVYTRLGNTFRSQKRYVEAISQYQKALEIDPKSTYALAMWGNALKAQGQLAEAITYYQKIIELDPEYGTAYRQLGNIAYAQGKIDEAQQFYNELYEIGEKIYALNRETIYAKVSFAERSLLVEKAEQAFALADDVIKQQLVSPARRLKMRFVVVTSLLYQQKRADALTELQALIADYRSLTEYDEKYLDYETLHNVISISQKLSDADKSLLLTLIEILKSPKAEGDEKLKELEAALPQTNVDSENDLLVK